MKKSLIFAVIIAVLAIAIVKNSQLSSSVSEVVVEPLMDHQIQASILASGRLSHEDEVLLSTEVIGKVTEVLVEEGVSVEEGQLLLRIDDETLIASVEQTQANARMQEIAISGQELRVSNLENQWQRKERLHDRGLLDDDSFELATNELDLARNDLLSRKESLTQAQATLEEAENRLDKTRVYSPLSGVITSLDIKVGEMAISSTTNVPGSSLMTIANPDSILTEVNVDEADIGNVEIGQQVEIVAIAYPDQPMRGVVNSIAMSAKRAEGSQSLSFVVKILFTDTNDIFLRPGMSCRAEIFTHENLPIPAVPIQAIQIEEDISENRTDYSVFINDNGIARKREIRVGISDDEYQEILEGLEEGEEVIIGPDRILRNLDDGDDIEVVDAETEEA